MIDVSHGGSSSLIASFLMSSFRDLVWFKTFYPLVSSVVTLVTTQALRAPWEPTCRQSTAWRLLATRVWICWRGQWTPWTSGETSWSSWTRTARSSALLRALTISRTWGMRWVTWSSRSPRRWSALHRGCRSLCWVHPLKVSFFLIIRGVSSECAAACPDRAPDAPPPAAVPPGHAEDWKWRGEGGFNAKNKADLLNVSVFVPLYQKTAYSVNISLKFSLFGLFVLMSVKVIQFKLCPPWHNILTWLFHIKTCKALKIFEWNVITGKFYLYESLYPAAASAWSRVSLEEYRKSCSPVASLELMFVGGTQAYIVSAEKRTCEEKLFLWKASKQFSYNSKIWVDILI